MMESRRAHARPEQPADGRGDARYLQSSDIKSVHGTSQEESDKNNEERLNV